MTQKRVMKKIPNKFYLLPILSLFILLAACGDKDCEIVQADWNPVFLYHDGMAPEGIRLEAVTQSADSYLWTVDGATSTKIRDTFTFSNSGEFEISLATKEGKNNCLQGGSITIRDYPFINSDRALSFFESDGTNVRLITKVIDNPKAANYVAIPYSAGLPENGGGMDYDNEQKKLFATPSTVLTSCYPNNADPQFPIPEDNSGNRIFFDTALDPGDDLAYVSGIEEGAMFIRSTAAYNGTGATQDIYTEADAPDFVYLTTDRVNNVVYWTKISSDTIYQIEKDSTSKVFLTGGPFYDLDFDNNKGLLFFAQDQDSSFGIRSIDPETGQIRSDAQSINGEISFIYIDEEEQEIFWANDDKKEIWKKRISFQMSSAEKIVEEVGRIRGMAVGNFMIN
ncbi:MAG: hypothetical protein ACI8YQ_001965 [Polaribacter sp.]|jgi:hypothetical protein